MPESVIQYPSVQIPLWVSKSTSHLRLGKEDWENNKMHIAEKQRLRHLKRDHRPELKRYSQATVSARIVSNTSLASDSFFRDKVRERKFRRCISKGEDPSRAMGIRVTRDIRG